MKNFDLRKYLAEGKLYEAINLDIEDGIAYLDGDSGTYEAEIEDGKASFSIMYDDLDYRISDQYDENNIEDFLGKGHAFVELAKKYDHNWDIERDLVGITIKLKDLAEGKLLNEAELTDDLVQRVAQAIADEFTGEDRELDLKYVITPNSIEAYPDGGGFDLDVNAGPNTPGDDWKDSRGFGIANYLGDYAGGSFVIRPEGNGHLVTNAASRNAKVAYITPEGEIEIISAEDSRADLGMNEAYTPGSGWTKDFDYGGMLSLALKLNADSPMDLLLKVSSDLEDVNYHRENSHLTDAIDAIKDGDRVEAKIAINRFRKEVKTNLNEDIIKERKITPNKTKMKKSELKEMIKMALSEDARTDAEQEGYKDGFEDAKDDIEAKLKDMKVSEAEEVDVEDNEKVDVDIEKDVEVDDESVETDIDVKGSMPGEDADEIAVQSLLMKAQEEAEKLGDEKLTDQIGNTITYFTRAHVATVDEAEEMDEIAALPGSTGVEDVNVDNPAEDAMVGLTETLRWQRIAGIAKDNGLYSK